MDKLTWQKYYNFTDEDMELIDLILTSRGRIVNIFDRPLDYELIKFNS